MDSATERQLAEMMAEINADFEEVGITDEQMAAQEHVHAADKDLTELVQLFPFHLPTLYNLARDYHVAEKLEDAREWYEKALACEERDEWRGARAGALCNLGLINQLHLNNATYAQDCYRRALETEEGHVQVMSNYAYLLLGGQKLSSRHTITADPQGAEELMKRVLMRDANHVATLTHLAYINEKMLGQEAQAEALYEKALALEPNNRVLLCNYAGFLCNVKEPYDPDTMMPVDFNTTCNTEDNFDPRTTLPIDPEVDRPCDRARALYNRALEGYNPPPCPTGDTYDIPLEHRFPLMHGRFVPSLAPEATGLAMEVSNSDAARGLEEAERMMERARAVAARASKL
mmetsp:Transcript_38646/g.90746  ORF Transcript_38646/g.90746 Transcript_38646/m.90746 type:complete len:346 (+) Transcript_38646:1-1038(+)